MGARYQRIKSIVLSTHVVFCITKGAAGLFREEDPEAQEMKKNDGHDPLFLAFSACLE